LALKMTPLISYSLTSAAARPSTAHVSREPDVGEAAMTARLALVTA